MEGEAAIRALTREESSKKVLHFVTCTVRTGSILTTRESCILPNPQRPPLATKPNKTP